MSSPILVTGGTGTLGRLVVLHLVGSGHAVRVLSRRAHEAADGAEFAKGDLTTGAGIEAALDGVGAIVHCASSRKGDASATRSLVRAASSVAATAHIVYISIVGVEGFKFSYYRSKLEAERVVEGSGLPWTTLRATQFYDFVFAGAQKVVKLPVVLVPAGFLSQPVDTDEVAARLVELVLDKPAGRVPDMGGPQVLTFEEVVRSYLRAMHRRRLVLRVPVPGTRAVREGGLLVSSDQTTTGYVLGRRTWEEFLSDRVSGATKK